jgi:glycine/D-amino acid oxidase-like deaminating enzyme
MRVLVLEASTPASGATAAGMGHLVVLDDSPAQLALTASPRRSGARLASRAVRRRWSTTLWHDLDRRRRRPSSSSCTRSIGLFAEHAIASEVLGPLELAGSSRISGRGLAGGLLVPGDGVVNPPQATRWLLERARAAGATVREGRHVDRIGANTVHCGDEVLRADVIVCAAGAETPRLVPELPIVPRKGYLTITDRHPGFVRHQLVELGYLAHAHTMSAASVAFNVQPRAGGQVIVGLVARAGGLGRRRSTSACSRGCSRARPSSSRRSRRCRWSAGGSASVPRLRQAAADRARGQPPPGLWIAAGHEGLGHHHVARYRADRRRPRRGARAADRRERVRAGALHFTRSAPARHSSRPVRHQRNDDAAVTVGRRLPGHHHPVPRRPSRSTTTRSPRTCAGSPTAGCAGIVTGGSLGEAATLTFDEKVASTRSASARSTAAFPSSPASPGWRPRVRRPRARRRAAGCDGIMALPAYVYYSDWREAREHYGAIIAATRLSCMLYNNPIAYRTDVLPEQLAELASATRTSTP